MVHSLVVMWSRFPICHGIHSLNKIVFDPGANLDTLDSVDGLHLIDCIKVRKSRIGSVSKPH